MQAPGSVTQLWLNLQYPIAVAVCLIVFSTVGFSILCAVGARFGASRRHELLLAPGIGMAVVALVATLVSRYRIGISAGVTWSSIIGITAVMGGSSWRRARRIGDAGRHTINDTPWWRTMTWLPTASVLGLVPYAQLFLRGVIPAGYMTSVTWTNNDLGAYLLSSTNVQRAGIGDAGLVTGINIGDWARFDHPAAHVLFSVISGIFRTEPHKVGIVYMATATAVLWCASIAVVENLSERRLNWSRALALSVVVLNVGVINAIANFFVSQIVTLAYLMVIFGIACIAMKNTISAGVAVVFATVSLVGFLTSPEVTVPFVPLLVLVSVMHTRAWRDPRQLMIGSVTFVVSVAVVAGLRWELLSSQFEVLVRNAGFSDAGWRTNYFSVLMLGGFVPTQYGGPYAQLVTGLDALILLALCGWLIRKFATGASGPGIPFGVFVLGTLLAVGASRWGIDAYRTWKMVVTCTPFLVLFLLAAAWTSRGRVSKDTSLSLAVCFVVIGASFAWTGEVWRNANRSSYINSNLASLATTPEARRQTRLNILVNPFFETMATASVAGDRALMVSPSYYFAFGQPLKPGCTLTTTENLVKLKDAGPIVAQRGNYVLVGTPSCK